MARHRNIFDEAKAQHRLFDINTLRPVLYLDAGTAAGVRWNDLSGYGNHGTLTNGPTFNALNGGNFVFDGVDDYIAFTDSNLIPAGGGGLSVSVWFRSTVKDKWVLDKLGGGFNGWGYAGQSAGPYQWTINGSFITTPVTTYNDGVWRNHFMTWQSSTRMEIFINGISVSSTTTSVPSVINTPAASFRVMGRTTNADYVTGSIAQLVVIPRLLTKREREIVIGLGAWQHQFVSSLPDDYPYKNRPPLRGD